MTGARSRPAFRVWGLIGTEALDYSTAIRRTVDDLAISCDHLPQRPLTRWKWPPAGPC